MTGPTAAVLVVHGIGSQARGATIDEFVDPLVDHLRTRHDVQVARSQQPTAAARLVVSTGLGDRGDLGDRHDWLVREAYWADAFEPPGPRDVASWLAGIGPWFVFFFIVRLLRRYARPELRRWLTPVGLATVAVLVPAAAFASVGMLALSLLSLLPLPGLDRLRRLQRTIALSIGDSYALVSSPEREDAMLTAIGDAWRNFDRDLDPSVPLVVVAHSQGAALVHRLLATHPAPGATGRPVSVVSIGAALVPISVLEAQGADRSVARRVATSLGVVALASLALLMTRWAYGVATSAWAWAIVVALTALGLATAWNDSRVLADPTRARRVLDRCDAPRWLDLWAWWDPVPNGPIPAALRRCDSASVAAYGQPWFDHVDYRRNRAEVIGRIATRIAAAEAEPRPPCDATTAGEATGVEPAWDLADGAAARRNRARRAVGAIGADGLVAAAVVGALAFATGRVAAVGGFLGRGLRAPYRWSGPLGRATSSVLDTIIGSGRRVDLALGVLVAVVAGALGLAVVAAVALTRQRRAERR